jgi:hypothetical protein
MAKDQQTLEKFTTPQVKEEEDDNREEELERI